MSTIVITSSSLYRSSNYLHSMIQSRRRYGSKLNLSRLLPTGNPSSSFPNIIPKEGRSRRVTPIYSGEPLGSSSPPPDPSSASWKFWILGMVISAILPFVKNQWQWLPNLLTLKQTVDKVVDTAEDIAEVVEAVAEGVEKVADEVADHLPDGGRLQKVAIFVENVARKAGDDAELAGDIIDKVEEMEDEVASFFKEKVNPQNGERLEEESNEKEDQTTNKESILEESNQGNGKLKEKSKEIDDHKVKDKTKEDSILENLDQENGKREEEAQKKNGGQNSMENIQTKK